MKETRFHSVTSMRFLDALDATDLAVIAATSSVPRFIAEGETASVKDILGVSKEKALNLLG